jgi:ABC-2 type transport system ATP-binding protein
MSIIVQNITKIYGAQKALDNISFEVKPGEIVGFLGPNGAGKSTMMKILTCYIPQTDGNATVCDYDVSENSIDVRKNIGYLPEHNPLYLDMYVKEYLQFIAGLHQISDKKKVVNQIIDKVGLGIEQNKLIGALSKGYRQRVGLAQAMIHDPKVLILDEPTTGLDPNQIVEIRNLIKEIGKEKTVMMSTHIMQEVEAICNRVIIINNGTIAANDDVSHIRSTVKMENNVRVEFNSAVLNVDLEAIEGVKHVKNIEDHCWIISSLEGVDVRSSIFKFAVEKEVEVLALQKEERSMEQIFKDLTASV